MELSNFMDCDIDVLSLLLSHQNQAYSQIKNTRTYCAGILLYNGLITCLYTFLKKIAVNIMDAPSAIKNANQT